MPQELEQRVNQLELLLRQHQHVGHDFTAPLRSLDMQEIGRITLAVAATSMSIAIPSRKYLKILLSFGAKSGASDDYLRFNSDSGNNYTTTTGTSQGQIDIRNGANSALGGFSVIEVANNLSNIVKPVFLHTVNRIVAAGTAISSYALFASWVNISAFINAVSLTSSGAATYPVGSEIIIFGSKQ